MGLTDEKIIRGTYLSIFNGKIVQKVEEGTEGAFERLNKNNKKVWEKRYKQVSGYLFQLYVHEHEEFGNQLIIKLIDKDGAYTFEMGIGTSYSQNFLNRLSNPLVDFKKEMAIGSYKIAREDDPEKFNEGMTIMQHGNKIAAYYTKETPHDLPRAEEKKEGKKKVWDFTGVNNFWIEKVAFWTKQLDENKAEILALVNAEIE